MISIVKDQLKQVFLNLLNNAHDSMVGVGGTITLKTELQNQNVAIHVKDTGCGMVKDVNVFERFAQEYL